MKHLNLTIEEMHEALKNNEITSKELCAASKQKALDLQSKLNAFVTITEPIENSGESKLSGIPCGIKDNFTTDGVLQFALVI